MTNEQLTEIKLAWAHGEEVQYQHLDGWKDWGKDHWLNVEHYSTWRIKPKTIRIGEYDVPEPLRDLRDGQKYYSVSLFGPVGEDYYADGCHLSKVAASMGLLHDTREAAELHSKALLSFTEKK